jgi:hypothetical protein
MIETRRRLIRSGRERPSDEEREGDRGGQGATGECAHRISRGSDAPR